jgi:hypothetical protein
MLCSTYHLPTHGRANTGVCTCFFHYTRELPPHVLDCVTKNLPVDSPELWGESHEEVESGSRRLVFSSSSMGLLYKLICPARWKEILIVFSHLSFPNASTILSAVTKPWSCFTQVFVFSWSGDGIKVWLCETVWENFWKHQYWWWWFEVDFSPFSVLLLLRILTTMLLKHYHKHSEELWFMSWPLYSNSPCLKISGLWRIRVPNLQ